MLRHLRPSATATVGTGPPRDTHAGPPVVAGSIILHMLVMRAALETHLSVVHMKRVQSSSYMGDGSVGPRVGTRNGKRAALASYGYYTCGKGGGWPPGDSSTGRSL